MPYHKAMRSLRLFIALPLPEAICRELVKVQRCLSAALAEAPLRLSTPEQLHLTLKFLGHTSEAALDELAQQLTGIAQAHRPMALRLGGLGAFPSQARPSVLWCGVEGELVALTRLHGALEQALAARYPAEERPFRPHLTLARLKAPGHGTALRAAIARCRVPAASWRAETLVLYRSVLHPEGARYEVLQRYQLT